MTINNYNQKKNQNKNELTLEDKLFDFLVVFVIIGMPLLVSSLLIYFTK